MKLQHWRAIPGGERAFFTCGYCGNSTWFNLDCDGGRTISVAPDLLIELRMAIADMAESAGPPERWNLATQARLKPFREMASKMGWDCFTKREPESVQG